MKVKYIVEELLQFNQEAEVEFIISTFDENTEAEDFYLNPYDCKTRQISLKKDATHVEFGLELNHKLTIIKG